MNENELNLERQKELYSLIAQCEEGVSYESICNVLNYYYPRWQEKSTAENSASYRLIRKDIRSINLNIEFKYAIMYKNKRFYIMQNETEKEHYLASKRNTALRMLDLYAKVCTKFSLEGNYQILLEEVKNYGKKKDV